MENQLQTAGQSTELTTKEIALIGQVAKVNLLIAYPLKDYQLEDWTRFINNRFPDLEPVILSNVINKFATEHWEWNYHKGIQNLMKGIEYELNPQKEFLSQL